MSDKLLPCPFCGGSRIDLVNHGKIGRGTHRGESVYSIGCYACGAGFPAMYEWHGRDALIGKWNARAAVMSEAKA